MRSKWIKIFNTSLDYPRPGTHQVYQQKIPPPNYLMTIADMKAAEDIFGKYFGLIYGDRFWSNNN